MCMEHLVSWKFKEKKKLKKTIWDVIFRVKVVPWQKHRLRQVKGTDRLGIDREINPGSFFFKNDKSF